MLQRPDDLVIETPTRNPRPAMRFRVQLDGTWIGMRLAYNGRADVWTIDLYDDAGTPIVLGVLAVEGHDLLRLWRHRAVPPGQLFVVDLTGQQRTPGRQGWATFARLVYRPASVVELAAGTSYEVPS